MWSVVCALFAIHSLGMFADEIWYHRRRGLPRWERWGHPLDTFTVLLCYGLALSSSATPRNLAVYIAAAAFSTVFVTKDEWIHARECAGGEMWLHACLFALHPVILGSAAAYMMGLGRGASGRAFFGAFLMAQTAVTVLFLVYQLLYWNGPWKPALPPPR